MKINLKDKKALIGGSSKGLGYAVAKQLAVCGACLLYTSPSPRDGLLSRMPSSA